MNSPGVSDTLTSPDDEAAWLITYADLVTLLLVFFVMLFIMSSLEKEKYKAAVETIKVKIDSNAHLIGLVELMEIPVTQDTQISIEDITGLRSRKKTLIREVNDFVQENAKKYSMASRILDGKIIVTVQGQTLFESGSANLKRTAARLLDTVVDILNDYPEYLLNIRGHTDDQPISTAQFPSNWELSAIRATTVLKHLILMGVNPGRLTATGFGDISPLVPNTSDANRAINRRVEFVLEKETAPY